MLNMPLLQENKMEIVILPYLFEWFMIKLLLICKHFDKFFGFHFSITAASTKYERFKNVNLNSFMFANWKALLYKFKHLPICKIKQVSFTKHNQVRFYLHVFWDFVFLFCLCVCLFC